mmetsp:Transcript_37315/g.60656  ORF Transcript_37315/g.60656 Transcript_37315/m.60656 type:complete len:87 (+) Transcript_37315:212-472(+)
MSQSINAIRFYLLWAPPIPPKTKRKPKKKMRIRSRNNAVLSNKYVQLKSNQAALSLRGGAKLEARDPQGSSETCEREEGPFWTCKN